MACKSWDGDGDDGDDSGDGDVGDDDLVIITREARQRNDKGTNVPAAVS